MQLWNFIIAVGVLAALAAVVFRVRRSALGLGLTLAGMWLLWGFWAYPILNDANSAAKVMRKAGEIAGAEGQIGLVGWKEQNLLLADRAVTEFGFLKPKSEQLAEAIRWQEADPERRWIFILDNLMAPCVDPGRSVLVGHANRRAWMMFRSDAVAGECRGGRVPAGKVETPEEANAE